MKNIILSRGNLLAVTNMQTPHLMSVYSVLHLAINQYEVLCKSFQTAPINNTRKPHHLSPVSSLYCLSMSILLWCSSKGLEPRNDEYIPAAENIQSGHLTISNARQNYGENESSSEGHWNVATLWQEIIRSKLLFMLNLHLSNWHLSSLSPGNLCAQVRACAEYLAQEPVSWGWVWGSQTGEATSAILFSTIPSTKFSINHISVYNLFQTPT